MKVAIVTDYLNQFGGAEIVTHEIAKLFPDADLYTLMAEVKVIKKYFPGHTVIQHPKMESSKWRRKHYRKLLPLYPTYIEDFDFSEYDLVISSSYLWAKSVLTNPGTIHISYIHTPMRQAWVKYHEYLENENDIGSFTKVLLRYVMNYLRIWDVSSANRVDYFIANSTTVQNRIQSIYRRDAKVIFPPIEIEDLKKESTNPRNEFYISIGRLVPYKRVDLMIEAFNKLPDKKLIILGDGNDKERLSSLVKSDNIELRGFVSEDVKKELLSQAKAFVFCAEEDFGMSPVEAMAVGVPIIAYNKAGARDYLQVGKNGIGFYNQTVEDLINAIDQFESTEFDKNDVTDTVKKFDVSNFRNEMKKFIAEKTKRSFT